MAILKKKIKLTDDQVNAAEPTFTTFCATKLHSMGACGGSGRWLALGARKRKAETRRAYQQFVDGGGKVGDLQSFLTWLMEHADEIISFLSKIIALFTV